MPIFMAKEGKQMYKRYTYLAVVASLLIFSGCGDDKKNKSESAINSPKIEVVEGAVKKSNEKQMNEENSGKFYYSYNKAKGEKEDNSTKVRTTLDAYLHIRSPYEKIKITMMIKRLSKDFIVRCSPCHDDYANGVIGPSLLGKDSKFIYGRLIDFKSGKRKNVLMKELVSQIDDKKLKSIADEIAKFNKELEQYRKGGK